MAESILGPDAPASPGCSYRDSNERRELLYRLLGDLPDRERPISARKVSEEEREGYLLEKLELDLNGFEPVPAFFAKPGSLPVRRSWLP